LFFQQKLEKNMNTLVPEANLFRIEHRPLATDALFHFELDPLLGLRKELMGYMPQIGFLALKEGGPNLVGFRPSGSEKRLYSHPDALLGLPRVPTSIEVCAVTLPDRPKIIDTRVPSNTFWSGKVLRELKGHTHAPDFQNEDMVIMPQSLTQAILQTIRTRARKSIMLPPSVALINPLLAVKILGGTGNET
jgi:hypothetical protein